MATQTSSSKVLKTATAFYCVLRGQHNVSQATWCPRATGWADLLYRLVLKC